MATVIVALAQDLRDLREPTVQAVVEAVRSVRASTGGSSVSASSAENTGINNVPSREIYLMVAGTFVGWFLCLQRKRKKCDIHLQSQVWSSAWRMRFSLISTLAEGTFYLICLLTSLFFSPIYITLFIHTGSKSRASNLDIHNKQSDRSEWDKAWTSGEQIFADLCHAIGMENFGPRRKLWAELLDVGSSDGLNEIANEMQQTLVRKYCDQVDQVLIVLPPHVLESEKAKEAIETTQQVFSSVWSKQPGSLLENVSIDFVR